MIGGRRNGKTTMSSLPRRLLPSVEDSFSVFDNRFKIKILLRAANTQEIEAGRLKVHRDPGLHIEF
jgi:hypothetical protein